MRLITTLLLFAASLCAAEDGFTPLFDGKTLNGWKLVRGVGAGYIAQDGIIVCPANGGGNLFTEKEYGDFVFRYEYRFAAGGNNGIGIRAPLDGDAAYKGMEIQILDDQHEKYKGRIKPEQHTGSIYDVFPGRTGFQKPAGEWNEGEILAQGSRIRVTLNGVILIDADLNNVKEEKVLAKHPGLRKKSGHIGFLGHGTLVEFRNIRVKPL
ncbi:MAG: DUF1080 domain-containing protein [Candidatus Solibacter usitatus]|nr:DUF1080 domain-containing protein [Candidatus Solibacter usitatus]